MKLQLISDIHLEFFRTTEIEDALKRIPIVGDVVLIAGDLTTSERFDEIFPKVVNYFKDVQVIYTPGNHCFWGWVKSEDFYHSVKKFESDKFHILNNNFITIQGQRFLGSTLWFNHDGIIKPDEMYWSDFMFIRDLYSWIHETQKDSIKFLRENIKNNDVVMTHHLPHHKSIVPKYKNNPMNKFFFHTICNNILEDLQPKLWVHGHSHSSLDYTVKSTRVVCNPVGYISELNPDFIKDLVINI